MIAELSSFFEALPDHLWEAVGGKRPRVARGRGGSSRGVEVQGLPMAQVQEGRWKRIEGEQGTLARRRMGIREQRQNRLGREMPGVGQINRAT